MRYHVIVTKHAYEDRYDKLVDLKTTFIAIEDGVMYCNEQNVGFKDFGMKIEDEYSVKITIVD